MPDNGYNLELLKQIHERVLLIDSKLDSKVEQTEHDTLAAKVEKIDEKQNRLALKVAALTSIATTLITYVGSFFVSPK